MALVPASIARDIIKDLKKDGWSIGGISNKSGLSWGGVKEIADGNRECVRETTLESLKLVEGLEPQRVLAWPTGRRIRSLRAIGWTISRLKNAVGVSHRTIENLTDDINRRVESWTADLVDEIFQEARKSPVSEHTVNNWPSPAEWSDIDDPKEVVRDERAW